jgi:hypothetical protein
MTEQEYEQALVKMWADWGNEKKQNFPTLLATEHNVRVILVEVESFFNNSGAVPRAKELTALVKNLGDIELGGKLQYHHSTSQTTQEPAAPTLPYPDEPELKDLLSKQDIIVHGERVSRKVLSQGGGSGGTDAFGRSRSNPLLEKLNARLQHLRLYGPEFREYDEETPEPKPARPIYTVPAEVTQAHSLVDAMNLSDIGTVTSSEGRITLLRKRKERFHQDINDRYANRESAKSILENTKASIKKSGDGGVQ